MSSASNPSSSRVRVALVALGDSADPAFASGTLFGLTGALDRLGVEVVHVRGELPGPVLRVCSELTRVRWAVTARVRGRAMSASISPWSGIEVTWARNAAARLRLRRVPGRLDGVIQMSSDFALGGQRPLVTYEDMTIKQAVGAGWASWRLPSPDLAWRIARQEAAYRLATACCTRTAWAAESIRRDYGIDAAKVVVVGVGRNREPSPASKRWEEPRFLFVAGDWERKNGPMVLEAFARIRAQAPTARLDIVGRHPPLDAPGVVGHGFLSLRDAAQSAQLTRLYADATCFVLPSLLEPLGISHLEAGAAGVPSIGTSNGGPAEVVLGAGHVVDPHDPEQLIAAMVDLCDPARAAAAGRAALERSRLYTWPLVAERLLAALGVAVPGGSRADFVADLEGRTFSERAGA